MTPPTRIARMRQVAAPRLPAIRFIPRSRSWALSKIFIALPCRTPASTRGGQPLDHCMERYGTHATLLIVNVGYQVGRGMTICATLESATVGPGARRDGVSHVVWGIQ